MLSGRFLVNGVVVDDDGQPVPSSDPYYYNALADEARQSEEQLQAQIVAGQQAANFNAIQAGSPPPFPEAGTPAVPNPADALGAVTSGAKWLMIAVGAVALYALVARRNR